MASNLTALALYKPALALIAGSGLPVGQRGLAALIIFLITLMVGVPLVLAAVVSGDFSRLLPALSRWMTANNRWSRVVLSLGSEPGSLPRGIRIVSPPPVRRSESMSPTVTRWRWWVVVVGEPD